MDLYSYLKRLFEYDDWANLEVVTLLQSTPYAPHKALRLMAHIVGTEFVWLARLQGQPDPAVWPEWNIAQIARERNRLAATVKDYLRSVTPERLGEQVSYTNTKGERWANSIADILMHVSMHSAYHRGQVAMTLRDSGIAPAYTDFIQAVRSQKIHE